MLNLITVTLRTMEIKSNVGVDGLIVKYIEKFSEYDNLYEAL